MHTLYMHACDPKGIKRASTKIGRVEGHLHAVVPPIHVGLMQPLASFGDEKQLLEAAGNHPLWEKCVGLAEEFGNNCKMLIR